MPDLNQQITALNDQIRSAVNASGRDPNAVRLIAASKQRSAEDIRGALQAGVLDYGENYVQEAIEKITELKDSAAIWHFIGPIQSNKTRDIAESFDWVHSVDRLRIAQRLNDQRPADLPKLKVLVQVNIGNEDSKSGCRPEASQVLCEQILQLPRLQLQGLMCIPPATDDIAEQAQAFVTMAQLRQSIISTGIAEKNMTELSMGMSGDFPAAIQAGATMIRIGTAIFGPRQR